MLEPDIFAFQTFITFAGLIQLKQFEQVLHYLVAPLDEDDLEDYILAKHAGVEKLAKETNAKTIRLDAMPD